MGATYKSISISKDNQSAMTPASALALLSSLFWKGRAAFDPCPASPTFDGLAVPWKRINFVNPPYESVSRWVEKAISESTAKKNTSVFLVPFRTKSRYTHEIVMQHATQIIVWMNRFKFVGYDNPIPATIATYVFGKGVACARSNPEVSFHRVRLHSWDHAKAGLTSCAV